MALGTPGGHGQSQTIAQALVPMLVFGLSPQAAVEAPRFRSYDGLSLALEGRMSEATITGLAAGGHDLTIAHGWTAPYGNLQVIRREENVVLQTGADMRREGAAAAY